MKRIYQYIDPKFKGPDDDTRWLAASTPEAAQAYAREHGWLIYEGVSLDEGPNEIFGGSRDLATRKNWTSKDYKLAGCDVVLA